jgi:hypothetical protein
MAFGFFSQQYDDQGTMDDGKKSREKPKGKLSSRVFD